MRRGHLTVNVGEDEADVLRQVMREYEVFLEPGVEDPVTERLFPAASLDDERVAHEYKTLTHDTLREFKMESLGIARRSIGTNGSWEGWVSDVERDAWLTLLTDLRLAIGTRLGVDEQMMERVPDPRSPDEWPLAVLHYLGALQESLVSCIEL